MIRIEFSPPTKRAIINRATDRHGVIHCEECGAACATRADYEIDHCLAEGRRIEAWTALTPADGKLLCKLKCHSAKTKRDMFEIAKTKRLEEKSHRPIAAGQTEIARRFGIKP